MSVKLTCDICGTDVPSDYQVTTPSNWGMCSIGLFAPDLENPGKVVNKMPMTLHICPKHDIDGLIPGALERDMAMALIANLRKDEVLPMTPAAPAGSPQSIGPPVPAPAPTSVTTMLPRAGQIPNARTG